MWKQRRQHHDKIDTKHNPPQAGWNNGTTTHIYAETGHLIDKTSHICGWHIQLGTADSEDNYTEEAGTEQHDVPESLPDVDIYEEDTPPTDEEYIEAAKIMMGEV